MPSGVSARSRGSLRQGRYPMTSRAAARGATDTHADQDAGSTGLVPQARPPRALDRVPYGPERTVVLALGVLGLAALIVYNGWYRGFRERVANLQQALVSLVQAAPPA